MKKALAVVAVLAVMGAASSWAQTGLVGYLDITLNGTLSPSANFPRGQKVTGADLAGNTNAPISVMKWAAVDADGKTNVSTSIGQVVRSNGVHVASVFLMREANVYLSPTNAKSVKFSQAFIGTGGSATNAVLIFNGTLAHSITGTKTNLTVAGTFSGIWCDGSSTVKGTFKSNKIQRMQQEAGLVGAEWWNWLIDVGIFLGTQLIIFLLI